MSILHGVYGDIMTTPEVAEEFAEELPHWIEVQPVSDKKYQKLLELQVDYGEASAIALASEFEDVLLLLDDLKARKLAEKLKFKFTGTLGVIYKAKQMNVIEKVKPIINKLLKTNFRISDKIVQEILKLSNE
ncbi:MAG: DUF3368 domain-containing protein, partial [Treponema sp.]